MNDHPPEGQPKPGQVPPAVDAPSVRPPAFATPPPAHHAAGVKQADARWPGPTPARPDSAPASAAGTDAGGDAPVKGRIHIADEVVEKVAALAAMEVEGVADLGGDLERAMETVRERIGIGNKRGDQGVKADVNGQQVTIGVTIMVEFGHVVVDVARRVQANVARQTQRMLGLDVAEVNVTVDDVRTAAPRHAESSTQPAVTVG